MPNPELKDLLASIQDRLPSLQPPRGLERASRDAARAQESASALLRRLAEGPSAPLRVAFFGPTGVGKSKLFNSILGSVVSPAGYRRPCTMRPVHSLHRSRARLAPGLQGEVRLRDADVFADVVFIDTPDFDSVEKKNREEADRIGREADAFVFVTDVQKYADQSTWEYLERITREGKPLIIVLNKVTGAEALDDFRSRLRTAFGREDVVAVAEVSIDDEMLLPARDGALAGIREKVQGLSGTADARRAVLTGAFRAEAARLLEAWDSAAGPLGAWLEGLHVLGSRLDERCEAALRRLAGRLSAPLDSDVKAEVYQRVLKRIQEIDILRYPRRLLALPFEGLKMLAGKWWPSAKGRQVDAASRAANEAFQLLEGEILSLADETRADVRSEARCPSLLGGGAETPRIPHEELLEMHARRDAEFRSWLDGEARETADKLTTDNKAKFILSQVIYNCAMVGVQIHTAGHFTLVELATDGVLSPLFAKAVGMAVSSERVRDFERSALARHSRLLGEVIEEARARIASRFEAEGAFREAFEAVSRDFEALRARQGDLLAAFEAGGWISGAAEHSRKAADAPR